MLCIREYSKLLNIPKFCLVKYILLVSVCVALVGIKKIGCIPLISLICTMYVTYAIMNFALSITLFPLSSNLSTSITSF